MTDKQIPVYIVDDDDSVRVALKRLVSSSGYLPESFSSARSFLDSVTPESKGILILDICMPEMNGFALQERVNQFFSSMKVIFITAHAKPGDREKALAAGAVGFLIKPFDEGSLLDLIERAGVELRK